MSEINLTQEQRDSYIEVITQILGVNGVNVKADNLDTEIITEVDNFIKEAQSCTSRLRVVSELFRNLTNIRKLAFAVVKIVVRDIQKQNISRIWASCYFIKRPEYARVIAELFIRKGGGTGIVY